MVTDTSAKPTLHQRAMNEIKEFAILAVYLYITLGAVINETAVLHNVALRSPPGASAKVAIPETPAGDQSAAHDGRTMRTIRGWGRYETQLLQTVVTALLGATPLLFLRGGSASGQMSDIPVRPELGTGTDRT